MQHDAKIKLLRQTQHGHDVIVPMRVVMDDSFFLQHFHERFQVQIAGRPLRGVIARGRDLRLVLAGPDEFLPHEERRPAASRREWALLALRVRAVGHLEAAQRRAVAVANDEVVNFPRTIARVAQFHVDRLATRQVARAGHDVQRR
jgi:hypothetical protein